MPYIVPKVFLSSTTKLKVERDTIAELLDGEDMHLFLHEEEPAGGLIKARLEKELASSEVLLVLLGADYGSIVPDDHKYRSWVEWEFDMAGENKVYPAAFIHILAEKDAIPLQREFIARVRQDHFITTYDDAPSLALKVQRSLHKWWQDVNPLLHQQRRRQASPAFGVVAGAALLCAGMSLAGIIYFLTDGSKRFAKIATGSSATGLCLCIVVGLIIYATSRTDDD